MKLQDLASLTNQEAKIFLHSHIEQAGGKNSGICKNTNSRFLIGQFRSPDRNPAI